MQHPDGDRHDHRAGEPDREPDRRAPELFRTPAEYDSYIAALVKAIDQALGAPRPAAPSGT